jgi:PTH1 family peptidyl-tRNA hydrolase
MENLRLIVGLGNPGRAYARTRHNAGFMAVEELARRWSGDWSSEKQFQARCARVDREGARFLLCLPETYMNSSGEAVTAVARYYDVSPDRILLVVDDADLKFGTIRLRPEGSSGGHHGLDSVTRHLGTDKYARLRVGIGRQSEGARQIVDYVLSAFGPAEVELLEKVLGRACDQIECWWREGTAVAMNRFNGSINTA